MPPINLSLQATNPSRFLLGAGFTSCKPRFRALSSGPRGRARPYSPPRPRSQHPSRHFEKYSKVSGQPSNPHQGQQNASQSVSLALRSSDSNDLISSVDIPHDPDGVLRPDHPATSILSHSSVVVTRQLELMNIMLGFEQANKYTIMDPRGNHIGYMAERELGMGNMMARQMFSTHRSFTTHVFDTKGTEVLRFHRPFSWISSRIGVYDAMEVGARSISTSTAMTTSTPGSITTEVNPESAQVSPLALADMRIIGEAQQQWAPLRRKYNLFQYRNAPPPEDRPESQRSPPPSQPLSNSSAMDMTSYEENGNFNQFAYVNEPFLSWDFSLLSQDSKLIGSVNRNFSGFGREIFTDTGVYALRMDAAGLSQEGTHLVSQTGQQAQVVDTSPSPGMTLDQRAVMLATAVSVDFDYFSRKSGSGGGWMPMWFPGVGGGAEAGEAGAEAGAVEGADAAGEEQGPGIQRGSSNPDDASPTNPWGENDNQPGQGGSAGSFWGNDNDSWGGNSGEDAGGDSEDDDWGDYF